MICAIFFGTIFLRFPNGFSDKHIAVSNFSLVNQPNLDKILKAKVFVYSDGQLRAAHLILGFNLFSLSFQASKCVIKAKDPWLHLINVVVPGFLNLGLGSQDVLEVEPLFQYKAEDEATPSQPATKKEEEEEEEEIEVVEVLDSEDDFGVFNRPQSPKASIGDFSHLPLT